MNSELPATSVASLSDDAVREMILKASRDRKPTDAERDALVRLLKIGRSDTGQSRRVADFLLAWWNAASCGGFDLTNLWALDVEIAADIQTVIGLIARSRSYPDALGFKAEFKELLRAWRPELQD